ncbi:DUF3592 domain-containing protein [Halobellus ordinarius]|uniref:DUF3592 domain-containing protein n=1 Tax=Halobellus ordinarius TaxID=3075120 RepID=UPI0028803F6F|nr:DUF3592 domain-containing protein [Halobellus sp. ZY16]
MPSTIGPSSFFAAVLLLVGTGLAGYGAYDYTQQSDAIEDAVAVDATIVETDVETVSSKGDQSHKPTVSFEYRYDGTAYTGDRIFPSDVSPKYETHSKAQSIAQEYESGETVTAYVDPAAPGDAFLEKRRSTYSLKLAGIGALIVLVTLGSRVRSSLNI